MGIFEYATRHTGTIVDWPPESDHYDPARALYRIRLSYEEGEAGVRWVDKFAGFLDHPVSETISDLVVGAWCLYSDEDSTEVVEALVAARNELPNLEGLFLGDISSEESEISWINQSDISPLFNAYLALEHFCVRGGTGLRFGALRHERLKSLIVQSGGLGRDTVRELATAHLPVLEYLELWLGDPNYGGDATVDDLRPILSGQGFPKLSYLGLCDSMITDDIAVALDGAPILERIRVLDLSMGTLGDAGAEALLANPAISRLEKLDIHHHYCSDAVVARLKDLGIEVDTSDRQREDEYGGESWRYVAVGE